MNSHSPWLCLCGALAVLVASAAIAPAAESPSCATMARKIQLDVAARPERVLIIVEDALVMDDTCACEVVKAAIVAAKATPKLVGQIVFTAVTASPTKAVLIAECATAASPDASGEIKSALRKALGGVPVAAAGAAAPLPAGPAVGPPADADSPGSGKNPPRDKNPPPEPTPVESTADFGLSPVSIGGVYLVYPGGGGPPQVVRQHSSPIVRHILRKPEVIIVRVPTATSSTALPPP